jgi:hypothetical protein
VLRLKKNMNKEYESNVTVDYPPVSIVVPENPQKHALALNPNL